MANNRISVEKIKTLQGMFYDDLKNLLSTDSDFCIFFEDENGNIIDLADITESGDSFKGLGSNQERI